MRTSGANLFTPFLGKPFLLVAILGMVSTPCLAFAQTVMSNGGSSGVSSGGLRPFVTGVIPVVGPNGAVGGVLVDADGVVTRAKTIDAKKLKKARESVLEDLASAPNPSSQFRKISLRGLDAEIQSLQKNGKPLTPEIEFLGGLQRVEYVFVDPKRNDVILAGPADELAVGPTGEVVGANNGKPILQLADLLVALRLHQDDTVDVISCSMDASEEGLNAFARVIRSRPDVGRAMLARCKRALGPFEVSVTGVPQNSRFARILVAADVTMKRLGMNLERSPVKGVSSYITMLRKSNRSVSGNSMPRWWLAPDYEALERDVEGLSWRIRGNRIRMMTEEEFLTADGKKKATQRGESLSQQWAEDFTEHYDQLAAKLPVFEELRNCMDWSVVAALLVKYQLLERARFKPVTLLNPNAIEFASYSVPQQTAPQVTATKKGRSWIVCASGGIEIDGWALVSNVKEDKALSKVRDAALDARDKPWWWD